MKEFKQEIKEVKVFMYLQDEYSKWSWYRYNPETRFFVGDKTDPDGKYLIERLEKELDHKVRIEFDDFNKL